MPHTVATKSENVVSKYQSELPGRAAAAVGATERASEQLRLGIIRDQATKVAGLGGLTLTCSGPQAAGG